MSRKVILAGHCGADNAYLKMAVRAADRGTEVLAVDDQAELVAAIESGADLVLVNRELGWGYDRDLGVELIRTLRNAYPSLKLMLISNYPEAQAEAIAAGALAGFGKREIGKPEVAKLLRESLERSAAARS